MPKTALDLERGELLAYNPGKYLNKSISVKRWKQAWKVARHAAHLLREQFKAKRVIAFGSITHKDWFATWSDIDLAVLGVPADRFYQAVAIVSELSEEFEIDLVDPEECHPRLREVIEQEGIDL